MRKALKLEDLKYFRPRQCKSMVELRAARSNDGRRDGHIESILQMRNQRLRQMKQLPRRSHAYSGSTRAPVQAVCQARAIKDYVNTGLRNT